MEPRRAPRNGPSQYCKRAQYDIRFRPDANETAGDDTYDPLRIVRKARDDRGAKRTGGVHPSASELDRPPEQEQIENMLHGHQRRV